MAMWDGLSGPPNLPQEVVTRLNQAVKKIIQSPELVADLEKIASIPAYEDPESFKNSVIEEGELAKKIREMGD